MIPAPNSRYATTEARVHALPNGETVQFLGRRIIPDLERYQLLDRHRTIAAERIDQVADAFYGDPGQYWRIADANGIERPALACLPVATLLAIPLPLELSSRGNA